MGYRAFSAYRAPVQNAWGWGLLRAYRYKALSVRQAVTIAIPLCPSTPRPKHLNQATGAEHLHVVLRTVRGKRGKRGKDSRSTGDTQREEHAAI